MKPISSKEASEILKSVKPSNEWAKYSDEEDSMPFQTTYTGEDKNSESKRALADAKAKMASKKDQDARKEAEDKKAREAKKAPKLSNLYKMSVDARKSMRRNESVREETVESLRDNAEAQYKEFANMDQETFDAQMEGNKAMANMLEKTIADLKAKNEQDSQAAHGSVKDSDMVKMRDEQIKRIEAEMRKIEARMEVHRQIVKERGGDLEQEDRPASKTKADQEKQRRQATGRSSQSGLRL